MTVHELIRARIYQEVQDYNQHEPEYFRGLVEPTAAERVLNGYKLKAKRKIDWEDLKKELAPGTPKPDNSALAPGALVFTRTSGPVPLNDLSAWWRWVHGAN